MATASRADSISWVTGVCRRLPGVSERLSHGSPAFFVERAMFATLQDDHHGDGRLAVWCAAEPGVQASRVASAPEGYFVPAYVGHRGWLGVRLDRDLSRGEIEGVLEDAWWCCAPARLRRSVSPWSPR